MENGGQYPMRLCKVHYAPPCSIRRTVRASIGVKATWKEQERGAKGVASCLGLQPRSETEQVPKASPPRPPLARLLSPQPEKDQRSVSTHHPPRQALRGLPAKDLHLHPHVFLGNLAGL